MRGLISCYLGAIILLAFLLRSIGPGHGELGFDEALSAVIAGKGLAGIIAYTQGAPFEHPPLYYLALHGWMQLAGSSDGVLVRRHTRGD